ncbi:hypothetical protein ADU37_CDS14680 [Thermococcus sp. 2319x1]|uniref:DUF257 family protein n=1 Tax=Thermococcus sp. 2319x1 TaxID=1674923 RepID=UPI00073ADF0C|nr:DUF257 family protein [Thermococcus sp. 2319x1]ALV63167.1 hypothetical protein ADU37_CDS14680 [Thermococcus sp. 2319x1]
MLLEYNSIGFPSFGFYSLVSWAKKKGYMVVVADVLDTLKLLILWLGRKALCTVLKLRGGT